MSPSISILIPHGYRLLESSNHQWIPVNQLLSVSMPKCWTGKLFTSVHVEPYVPNGDDHLNYVVIDAVTTLAEDSLYCPLGDIWVRYHWMPPWASQQETLLNHPKRQPTCKAEDHAILAMRDFLDTKPYDSEEDANWLKAYLPRLRLKQLNQSGVLPTIHDPDEKTVMKKKLRYHTLRIPASLERCVCESSMTKQGREHALNYINTVMAIKSIPQKRYPGVVEVKDEGVKLRPEGFRRLRRALTMCALRTRYAPRVVRCRNGKGRPYKRTMKLAFSDGVPEKRHLEIKENVCDSEREFFGRMKISPRASLHKAKLIRGMYKDNHRWYRVTIDDGNEKSLIVEGIMMTLSDKNKSTEQKLTLIPPDTK